MRQVKEGSVLWIWCIIAVIGKMEAWEGVRTHQKVLCRINPGEKGKIYHANQLRRSYVDATEPEGSQKEKLELLVLGEENKKERRMQ